MVKRVATVLGLGFLLVGLLGFLVPNLLGAHLSTAHNLVHIVTGALSLWFGLKATPAAAKTFDVAFGAVYALLGVAGFAFGSAGLASAPHAMEMEQHLLKVVPGTLEFGVSDHLIHIALGGIYLLAGLATHVASEPPSPPPSKAHPA